MSSACFHENFLSWNSPANCNIGTVLLTSEFLEYMRLFTENGGFFLDHLKFLIILITHFIYGKLNSIKGFAARSISAF